MTMRDMALHTLAEQALVDELKVRARVRLNRARREGLAGRSACAMPCTRWPAGRALPTGSTHAACCPAWPCPGMTWAASGMRRVAACC
jgi:hypothetical protein